MGDVFTGVVGQQAAVSLLRASARRPVHAYLFSGPAGTGKRTAAHAFAAALLCPSGGCGDCLRCRRALAGTDPDLIVVEREGASISTEQVDEIIRLAARAPVEGARKVLVLVDFHLVAQQYPRLLKTLEEPPPSTVFLLLVEHLPPELVTIASRCLRVDFGPLPEEMIIASLVADGARPEVAARAAAAAGGRIDRARLLVTDPHFEARHAAWRNVAERLNGTGAAVATLVDELLAATESVLDPLKVRQASEAEVALERAARLGERGSGRRDLEERQRREQRRVRMDELRSGLATLAGEYRDRLAASGSSADAAAVDAIQTAGEALVRNPHEALLLAALFCRLTNLAR